MQNVTPAMRKFVERYTLPEAVLADFDRWFESRKGFKANDWKAFVSYANTYAS